MSLELLDRSVWPDDQYLGCLYSISNHPEEHYHAVHIPKRDGTVRRVYEPAGLLKQIQKNILHRVLAQFPVSVYATAYKKDGGIRINASHHQRKEQILKLDIEHFYDHVMFYMVYQCAFPAVRFPPPVRTLLTHLCCYKECLPQGAPTSAYISNLVLRPLDEYMGTWCEPQNITYSRYSDDITCSGSFNPHAVIRICSSRLQMMGFYLKEEKTRIISQGCSQIVTGITVNDKLQVPRAYRDELRRDLYYCCKYGPASHLAHLGDTKYLPREGAGIRRYLQSLLGRINFVLSVNGEDAYFQRAAVTVRTWLSQQSDQ